MSHLVSDLSKNLDGQPKAFLDRRNHIIFVSCSRFTLFGVNNYDCGLRTNYENIFGLMTLRLHPAPPSYVTLLVFILGC